MFSDQSGYRICNGVTGFSTVARSKQKILIALIELHLIVEEMVYVANTNNSCIQKFTVLGKIPSTLWLLWLPSILQKVVAINNNCLSIGGIILTMYGCTGTCSSSHAYSWASTLPLCIIHVLEAISGCPISYRVSYKITLMLTPIQSFIQSIFCVKAGCEISMASYTSKHALQSLSDKPFLRIELQYTLDT